MKPNSSGHKFGPESTQRKNMIKQVDRTVGYLRQRIRESGLESNLNLIITSDHGMETVLKTDEIHIRTVSNFTFRDIDFELLDYGPNGFLVPKEGKLEHVYSVLKNAHPKLHVYKKEEFPKRFHYANHSRITPLLLYSDPGYQGWGAHLCSPLQRYKVQFNKGEHGFDNEATNMKTIFRATGPAFKKGLVVEPFESVHVYALLCELLGITPEPHDGSLEKGANTRPVWARSPRVSSACAAPQNRSLQNRAGHSHLRQHCQFSLPRVSIGTAQGMGWGGEKEWAPSWTLPLPPVLCPLSSLCSQVWTVARGTTKPFAVCGSAHGRVWLPDQSLSLAFTVQICPETHQSK
uniref:Ectonucleotide pyrophosphatase/phosphodiesterase 7 n=1 Tax=Taeniopygia guttata TaxID=59729 RepID=H0YY80_TAEGU